MSLHQAAIGLSVARHEMTQSVLAALLSEASDDEGRASAWAMVDACAAQLVAARAAYDRIKHIAEGG